MLSWIGWIATAMFAASYFCKEPARLRLTQALAALLWIIYGVAIAAPPVIVANVIVAAIAATSAWRQQRADSAAAPRGETGKGEGGAAAPQGKWGKGKGERGGHPGPRPAAT